MECTSMTIQVNKTTEIWTNLPWQRRSTMIVFLFSAVKRGKRLHELSRAPALASSRDQSHASNSDIPALLLSGECIPLRTAGDKTAVSGATESYQGQNGMNS